MPPQCISIIKYTEIGNIIYYHVIDVFKKNEFYIGIDPLKKQIDYYETSDFNKPLKTIDLANGSKPMDCVVPEIDPDIVFRINIIIYKAIKNNLFPDDLSYASGG